MKAHLVQLDIVWEDRNANFARVERLLAGAGVVPGDLVLLPELFDSGFSLNTDRTRDGDGRTAGFLADLAERLGAVVQGGRTVRPKGHTHATNHMTVYAPDGRLISDYAKIHPFSFGKEPEAFVGGERVVTYDWRLPSPHGMLKVCPAVCYDLRFPELFRIGLRHGAELFALGANWPEPRQAHWRALLIARAIENQAFVLGVNRTGPDPHLNYVGGSIAAGPRGEVLGELGDEEAVLSVDIDPEAVRNWRRTFPAWRDFRLTDLTL